MKSKISEGNRATLASEIATLTEATPADLKSRWRVLYGAEPPPRISRDLLTRAIAYRIQEERARRSETVDAPIARESCCQCLGATAHPGNVCTNSHAGNHTAARLARHPTSSDRP